MADNEDPYCYQKAPRIFRAVVIEDVHLMAALLGNFCAQSGLKVLELCGTYRQGLATIRHQRPDLVLLDLSLPDGDGLDLAKIVQKELPLTKILVVSSHCDSWTLWRVQRSGVHGFIDKNDISCVELLEAIESIIDGRRYDSKKVTKLCARFRSDSDGFIRVLSDHEIKILSLIGECLTDAEIGIKMSLSTSTIQSRRRDIMQKINVHTTPKLIHYAVINGLTRMEHLRRPKVV